MREKLNDKYWVSYDDLRDLADFETDGFDEWVKVFGLVVSLELDFEKIWLGAKWFNKAGYQLLTQLQNDKLNSDNENINQPIAHEVKNIIEKMKLISETSNEKECIQLLQKLKELLLVAQTADKKIVFPSILPTNDPDFLSELRNSDKYTLYGTFNAHVEFMPMGLFSQWVVKWLSLNKEKNNDFKLEEHHYSQFCCILSSESVYLVVKWHPYYKTLMFAFYHPKNENKDTKGDKNHLNAFALLLSNTLETIALHKHWLIADKDFSNYMQNSNIDIINHFIDGLKNMSTSKLPQQLHFTNKKQGDTYMTNNYNAKNQLIGDIKGNSVLGDGNTVTQTTAITENTQNNYLHALEQLKTAYMAETQDTQKQEIFQKVYEAAKADVEAGELSTEKVEVWDSIVTGIGKTKDVAEYAIALFNLYGAASLI